MKYFLIPALALLSLAAPSAAEMRNLHGFSGISAAGRFDVEVTIGPEYRVEVTGPDAARVATRVEGDLLELRDAEWRWFGAQPQINATVRVVTPELNSLAASRGAEVRATNLNVDQLSLAASMGGELSASGRCQELDVAVSMGAELNASDLHCATVSVSTSMGAEARVYASQSVSSTASMGADVRISGNPQSRSARTSMGADVSYN